MDISQLQRSIENLQYDSSRTVEYSPFLGVVNYDFSEDRARQRLINCCEAKYNNGGGGGGDFSLDPSASSLLHLNQLFLGEKESPGARWWMPRSYWLITVL